MPGKRKAVEGKRTTPGVREKKKSGHERRVSEMVVKDIMHRNLITVREDTPIKEVCRLMVEHKISSMPVIDADKRLLGIIPEDHLIGRLRLHGLNADRQEEKKVRLNYQSFIEEQKRLYGKAARDIVEKNVRTVTENMDVIDAINLMLDKGFARFPVVRGDKLVGVLSRADIIKALSEMELRRDKFTEDEPGDEEITKKITAAFKEHLGMQMISIRIQCKNGVVRLSGEVGSQDDSTACEAIARSIEGAKSVENNLVIDALLK
jgi:CBS domain-containing protein